MNTKFGNDIYSPSLDTSLIDHVKKELKSILPSIKVGNNFDSISPPKFRNIVLAEEKTLKRRLL